MWIFAFRCNWLPCMKKVALTPCYRNTSRNFARKMACRLRLFALCVLSLRPRRRFGPIVIFNPSPLSQIERITGKDAEEVQMKSPPFKKRESAEPRSALSSVFLRFFIQLKIKQNSIGGIGNAVSHPVHLQNLFGNGEA